MKKDEGIEMKETKETKEAKCITVEYNGSGGWAIDFAGRGSRIIAPGEKVPLNIHDKQELHAILQIVKQINSPKTNTDWYLEKGDRANPHKSRIRFKISEEDLQLLPPVLRKLQFQQNSLPSDEEAKAITSLVPDYYVKEEKLYKVQR